MAYKHPTGTIIKNYNSHSEHTFYEETTKRQMFLIIEQLCKRIDVSSSDWVGMATEERELLKIQNIT